MHPNTHHIYPLLPRVPLDLGRPERPSSSSHPIQVELCPASSDFCAQITLPLTSEASHRLPPSSFGPSLADQEGQSVVLTGITETLHTIQEKLHEILDTRVSELNNHRRISNELHLDGISEMNGQSPKVMHEIECRDQHISFLHHCLELCSSVLTGIIENSQCTICLDLLSDPRILPCGHMFCTGCIFSTICPLCRAESPLLPVVPYGYCEIMLILSKSMPLIAKSMSGVGMNVA
ncbi:hypothetical protein FRC14_002311 [Serendipita sp. 396]|nr:hypothetical protein FRC14_002311 [Serendipita sp. 396]KAG8800527.1 hypothetical protein FRC16_002716 [Serendipita sp. 398]KAG8823734.1 hypothetical protein FRC19_003291 [Serendipita sp. 401]KAG8834212.1 hypothetical protein FRC18_002368 [Serendipita sp. 400]KAG8868609.1 hypothetical protein FRC20_003080 [Serendipita sp. 405]KAG9055266.1 hypothetical protein FS842_002694 [Serendipita sp. 407]